MRSFTTLFALAGLAQSDLMSPSQIPLSSSATTLLDPIPLLGFGTWNLHGSNATAAVSHAIQAGYRHIDCAAAYRNEPYVGAGIAEGLAKAGLDRTDIWVTSKLWNDQCVLPTCRTQRDHS